MRYIPPHERKRRPENRYKSIVIPYIETTYNKKTTKSFVLVKDTANNEYTFVVGGCKLNEQMETCALRELKEETRGIFGNISKDKLVWGFQFDSKERSPAEKRKDEKEGVDVTMIYTVYYLPLMGMNKTAFNKIIKPRFENARP